MIERGLHQVILFFGLSVAVVAPVPGVSGLSSPHGIGSVLLVSSFSSISFTPSLPVSIVIPFPLLIQLFLPLVILPIFFSHRLPLWILVPIPPCLPPHPDARLRHPSTLLLGF